MESNFVLFWFFFTFLFTFFYYLKFSLIFMVSVTVILPPLLNWIWFMSSKQEVQGLAGSSQN